MKSPELIIILINIAFMLPAYFYFYPKYAGSNGNKVALYDLFITIAILGIAYVLYGGKHLEFNMLFTHANWFWFTLLTYMALEIPLMMWYYKKNNVWESLK